MSVERNKPILYYYYYYYTIERYIYIAIVRLVIQKKHESTVKLPVSKEEEHNRKNLIGKTNQREKERDRERKKGGEGKQGRSN